MSSAETVAVEELLPIVPYLTWGDAGAGFMGCRCAACGTVHVGQPSICPRCGDRRGMECIALGTSGTLYNYTVVHRSLPGVPTPFVSAVIDLDGGGSIKANLDAPAADLRFGMPVKAIFEKLGQVDVKGRAYFGFRFVPA